MSRRDSCPGVLQLHQAADGPLARVRVPGGTLTSVQLQALSPYDLELTSRGNIQIRAVTDPQALQGVLEAAGLLPSISHERVRNIVASPLSGRVGEFADVRELVTEFDERLCAIPMLAELPGRILFGFDDGRGDITELAPDVGVHAAGEQFAVVIGGQLIGETDSPLETMLAAARAFLRIRTGEWRIADVPNGIARVAELLGLTGAADPVQPPAHPIGWFDQNDGRVTLVGGLRFGTLDSRLAQFIAAVEAPLTITPWRSMCIHDLDESVADTVLRVLAPMGVIFDAESPWLQVTACTGMPRCAKALGDVRADATAALQDGALPVAGPQHWSGCSRRCGKPRHSHDVVATADGYRAN